MMKVMKRTQIAGILSLLFWGMSALQAGSGKIGWEWADDSDDTVSILFMRDTNSHC